MRCDFQVKIEGGDHCQAGSEEIGHVKRGKLGDIAAQNQPDSDAYIPRGEIGGSGCAALAVRSKLTNSVLKAGNMVPNPTPSSSATMKKSTSVSSGFICISLSQAERVKKQMHTR